MRIRCGKWPFGGILLARRDTLCGSRILYMVLSVAIKLDLQTFSRSREAAVEQPRLRPGLEPGVLICVVSDLELAA